MCTPPTQTFASLGRWEADLTTVYDYMEQSNFPSPGLALLSSTAPPDLAQAYAKLQKSQIWRRSDAPRIACWLGCEKPCGTCPCVQLPLRSSQNRRKKLCRSFPSLEEWRRRDQTSRASEMMRPPSIFPLVYQYFLFLGCPCLGHCIKQSFLFFPYFWDIKHYGTVTK